MNIQSLSQGAAQPFYSVGADDGSIRYVAQENILQLANVSPEGIIALVEAQPKLGRYFRSVNRELGLFLLSPLSRKLNPACAEEEDKLLQSLSGPSHSTECVRSCLFQRELTWHFCEQLSQSQDGRRAV